MDYKALAEAALEKRAQAFEQRKSIQEDANLSDAEKRERIERVDADMDTLAAEARSYVEQGERDAETRALMDRAGALRSPLPGGNPGGEQSPEDSLNEDLRALILGPIGQTLDISAGGSAKVDAVARRSAQIRRETRAQAGTPANTTTNPWAGFTVPQTFVAQLLESMYKTSDVVSQVKNITTAAGEVMNWPRLTSRPGGAFTAVGEGATYGATSNGVFEQFSLSAHKFGALTQITYEQASDSELNIAEIIASDIGETLAYDLAGAVWNGSAANGPKGLLKASSLISLAAVGAGSAVDHGASTAAIGFVDLIDLQHKIISPYRKNAAFYMNDDTGRQVRHLVDGQGRYLWQPAVVAGEPDTLLGDAVYLDYQVPTIPTATATNVPVVAYGDLNRAYVLRTVRSVQVTRSLEYGFDQDLITLKTTWRGDGGVADVNAYAALTVSHA